MVVHHTLKQIVPLSKDEYWSIVFTDEFDLFCAPFLKFKRSEPHTLSQEGAIVKREVTVYPDYHIPSALLWYLNQSEFHYNDIQEKNMETGEVHTKTVPPVHADMLHITTHQYIEAIDEHSCYHVMNVEITCHAWGIGSIVEHAIISGVEEGYALLPKAVEAFKNHKQPNVAADHSLHSQTSQVAAVTL